MGGTKPGPFALNAARELAPEGGGERGAERQTKFRRSDSAGVDAERVAAAFRGTIGKVTVELRGK